MKKIFPITLLLLASISMASDNPERPDLQAGKLFTVRVTPKAKTLEVEVAGKGVAEAEMTKLGLFAKLKIGEKDIVLTPVKKTKSTYVNFRF